MANSVAPANATERLPNPAAMPVASRWHTAGLVTIILAFAVTGRVFVAKQAASTLEEFGRVRIYLLALASMWLLAGYVQWGIPRGTGAMRQLMDESTWTWRRMGTYALIAIAMMVAWSFCGGVLGLFLRPPSGGLKNLLVLLPKSFAEKFFGSFCQSRPGSARNSSIGGICCASFRA